PAPVELLGLELDVLSTEGLRDPGSQALGRELQIWEGGRQREHRDREGRGGPVVVAPRLVGVLEHRGLAILELARQQVRNHAGAAVAEGGAAPAGREVVRVALVAPADPGGKRGERLTTSSLL